MGSDDHIRRNREAWEERATVFDEVAEQAWRNDAPGWGIWRVSESDLGLLPDDLEGKNVIELGCGTAYVSPWLVRRGARSIGLDFTWPQLATAIRFSTELGLHLPLVQADAERAPFRDASFDIAISEYGASIWCDPYRWIPEASRLLRPGGELVFLVGGTILMMCSPDEGEDPADDCLLRPYFGMHRFDWPGNPGVTFTIGYGDWIRLLRANGFEVEDLIEIRPPEDSTSRYPIATLDWARRWPSEEVWKARKVG